MGKHTAPIPIVQASTMTLTPVGPVTDPHLFDRPLPPAAVPAASAPEAPAPRRPRPVIAAPVPPHLRAPAPAPFAPERDDDGIDETPVAVIPRSVRSVLDAEEAAAAEELPPPRFPRARDLVFGAAALAVLGAAVGAALLP
jgi:hypothetical protein